MRRRFGQFPQIDLGDFPEVCPPGDELNFDKLICEPSGTQPTFPGGFPGTPPPPGGRPGTLPSLPSLPTQPPGGEIPGTNQTVIDKTELDTLRKQSGQRWMYGAVGAAAGVAVGALVGALLGR